MLSENTKKEIIRFSENIQYDCDVFKTWDIDPFITQRLGLLYAIAGMIKEHCS